MSNKQKLTTYRRGIFSCHPTVGTQKLPGLEGVWLGSEFLELSDFPRTVRPAEFGREGLTQLQRVCAEGHPEGSPLYSSSPGFYWEDCAMLTALWWASPATRQGVPPPALLCGRLGTNDAIDSWHFQEKSKS